MSSVHEHLPERAFEPSLEEIQARLRAIERIDWWYWLYASLVMLLLTLAVVSLSLPSLLREVDPLFRFHLNQSARGLTGLVLLFNVYTIYQQILIKRLRRELAEKQLHAAVFRKLAMFDPLTGLHNRWYAEQRLATEVARSERRGHPLTVLLLDLDQFKQINDTCGHAAGDLVLKEFAERLRKAIRGSDLAVRHGGDEFMVVLTECQVGQLQTVLARLDPFEVDWNGTKIPVTFSAGWKEYQLGERPQDLFEGADRALYNNKRTGKTLPSPLSVVP